MAGVVLVGLLTTAAALRPSSTGIGTHQQLGLPPCTFQVLWGSRCPACGMTTSWSHLLNGNLQAAMAANVGGAMLAVVSLAATPWLFASAWRGTWLWFRGDDWEAVAVLSAVLFVTLVDWSIRIWLGN